MPLGTAAASTGRLTAAAALLCWAGPALGQELRVELRAHVSDDLTYIAGMLRWDGPPGVRFEDYIGALPPPPDDRTALRTWPGGPEQGGLSWHETSDDRGRLLFFELEVPDRYGAVGRVPGYGLYLNGGWYPVPVDADGRVLEAQWDVVVDIPDDAVGGLACDVGEDELRWRGAGERVPLAVIPGGRIERLDTAAGQAVLLSERGFTQARQRWLRRSLEAAWPREQQLQLVIVDAPLMRRLVRPGPGLLYLSSRAFRVNPGLKHLHLGAVTHAALTAGLNDVLPGHGERDLAAALLAALAMDETPTAEGLLRWFSWLPQIDELLYSGSVPYVSEVMGEPWPGDPLADDLLEVLDPRVPGAVYAARALAHGEPAALLAQGLLAGEAAPAWLARRRYTPYEQDYKIDVRRDGAGAAVRITRDAPPGAPAETLVLAVDDARPVLELPEGEDEIELTLDEAPTRVVLDPDRLLRQTDRANDRWPSRWTTVVSAFPTVWNLSSGRLEGYLALRFRRQHDTRWYYDSYVFRDEVDEIGVRAAVGHSWGPLQDRRWRPYRLYLWSAGSLLDADFRPTQRGRVAVDAGATFAWDTQVDWLFPLRGHQLVISGHGGGVPGSDQRWAGVSGRATGVASPHPRVAVAAEARAGRSWAEVEHRLQVLGGVDNLRSLPANAVVGNSKLVGRGELRVAPLRHVSVPLGFAWLDELQLSGGLEAGLVSGALVDERYGHASPDGWMRAAGWTGGSFVVIDVLGGQPALAGLVVAGPLATDPVLELGVVPNVYLLWEQAF